MKYPYYIHLTFHKKGEEVTGSYNCRLTDTDASLVVLFSQDREVSYRLRPAPNSTAYTRRCNPYSRHYGGRAPKEISPEMVGSCSPRVLEVLQQSWTRAKEEKLLQTREQELAKARARRKRKLEELEGGILNLALLSLTPKIGPLGFGEAMLEPCQEYAFLHGTVDEDWLGGLTPSLTEGGEE